MAPSTTTATTRSSAPTGPTKAYLFAYNTLNLVLWGSCVVYTASQIPFALGLNNLPAVFKRTFSPLLLATQSLATLEVLHSLVRLVRAPFLTTAMQVASRLLLVWGIMAPFGGEIVGREGSAQLGDYAYLGCVGAWGITEVIRYGFFAITLSGNSVPAWWTWLRYNTFYVLYPIGISSECTLILQALGPAAELNPLFQYALIAILVIYVPGSYILYTHMIAQRRKVMRGKQRAD
ncbi:Protein-tyrosine phosphatase-like [Penicillium alfredii]|uniref:Very-long-chain (3R)-3-hydroxyacyl-CoA dehydratase n=1 Tax=Penicillium alfredii TaxID=1506179 RepID=A0A9W9KGT0_9EURO|nr:Protein-tyrosine phosphatase-like [Penicillium alfredii]KAJ5105286.1 Protein-tyrosine phosphatase-like [Penicillium alfredii]